MGEVYVAHDPTLEREVALKVLRADSDKDPRRLDLFVSEARASSRLNHPNVVAVYDAGLHEGRRFIVSELLVGETLAERLRAGRLPPARAIEISIQIARGLAAAHEAGILHRDLKPANVFLTRDGGVKILDFGLAQWLPPAPRAASGAWTAGPPTPEGEQVLGTPGYMSPEQVRGDGLDPRSDLFSLGSVLYEMLAGRRAFVGRTEVAVLAAILSDSPPPLQAAVPQALLRIVDRCLEKEPDRRFRSAHDLALALAAVQDGLAARHGWARRRALGAAAACGLGGAVWVMSSASGAEPGPFARREIVPLATALGSEFHPALSADGKYVAWVSDEAERNNFDIHVRPVDGGRVTRLTDSPAFDCSPQFSPAGTDVAFVRVEGAEGRVLVVPATGGPERDLGRVEAWHGTSLAWSADGRKLIVTDRPAAGAPFSLFELDVGTGVRRRLTAPPPHVAGDAYPAVSPDGQTLAFARLPTAADTFAWADFALMPAGGGEARFVHREPKAFGGAVFAPDGRHLVFVSRRIDRLRLLAVRTDGGGARMLDEDPEVSNAEGAPTLTRVERAFRLAVAPRAGRLAYVHSNYDTGIWLLRRGVPPQPWIVSTQIEESPQWSPDGRRIAFSSTRGGRIAQLWTCDHAGRECRQVTNADTPAGTPRWAPDGRHLVYDRAPGAAAEIFMLDVETGLSRQLSDHPASDVVPSVSRDGRHVYFASDRDGAWHVYSQPLAGGVARRITDGPGFAAFESPDGRWLYYSRYEEPGLWRKPVAGGAEERVLNAPQCWGYWTVGAEGVYFVGDNVQPAGRSVADPMRVLFWREADRTIVEVGTMPGIPVCGESGLSISPDDQSLLAVTSSREADIYLMAGRN